MLRVNDIVVYTELVNSLLNQDSVKHLVRFVESFIENNFKADYTAIYVFNKERERLELKFAHGFSEEERVMAEKTAMERHPGEVFKNKKGFYVPDTLTDNTTVDSPRSFSVRSRLYRPIIVEENVRGVFGIVSGKPNAFSEYEIKFFELFCTLCSIAFDKIEKDEQLREVNNKLKILSFLATKTEYAVLITDNRGRITWANDGFLNHTGYSQDEIINKKPGELLQGKETDVSVVDAISKSLELNKSITGIELVNYKKNGEMFYNLIDIYPLNPEINDKDNYFISLQKDITPNKILERNLKTEQDKLNRIIETLPDAILIISPEGTIIEFIGNHKIRYLFKEVTIKGSNYRRLIEKQHYALIEKQISLVNQTDEIHSITVPFDFKGYRYYLGLRFSKYENGNTLVLVSNATKEYQLGIEKSTALDIYQIISDFSFNLSKYKRTDIRKLVNSFLNKLSRHLKIQRITLISRQNNLNEANVIHFWQNSQLKFRDSIFSDVTPREFQIPIQVGQEEAGLSIIELNIGANPLKDEIFHFLKTASEIIFYNLISSKSKEDLERTKIALDTSREGVIILDNNNVVVYSNRKSRELLKKYMPHNYTNNLSDYFPEEFTSIKINYDFLLTCNFNLIVGFNTNGNSEEFFEIKSNKFQENNKTRIAIVFNNITEELNNKIQLEKSIEIVNNQNNKLLNFSYMVSHNLRSHSSTISSLIEFIFDEKDEHEKQRLMNSLKKVSDNLDNSLRDMTTLISINNSLSEEFKTVNLYKTFETVLQTMITEIRKTSAKVTVDIPENLEIKTVPAYIESIITNLISNSIKYRSLDRTLKIAVSAVLQKNQIQLQIRDNGIGIDLEKNRNEVFKLFTTFHSRANAHGIGLHLVKIQTEKLGGNIAVTSQVNKGTLFTITLPQEDEK